MSAPWPIAYASKRPEVLAALSLPVEAARGLGGAVLAGKGAQHHELVALRDHHGGGSEGASRRAGIEGLEEWRCGRPVRAGRSRGVPFRRERGEKSLANFAASAAPRGSEWRRVLEWSAAAGDAFDGRRLHGGGPIAAAQPDRNPAGRLAPRPPARPCMRVCAEPAPRRRSVPSRAAPVQTVPARRCPKSTAKGQSLYPRPVRQAPWWGLQPQRGRGRWRRLQSGRDGYHRRSLLAAAGDVELEEDDVTWRVGAW
jgi:hypothetical protein